MAQEKKENADNKNSTFKNDVNTNTTDPQEHMEGPLSSLMQKGKEQVKENDEKDKEENKE